MDRTCTADFMPELYHVGGRREWETECSYGFLSIGVFALLVAMTLLPQWHPGFIGWEWMTNRQRSRMRAALAPSVLLSGIGAYHHDGGWLTIGLCLCVLIPTAWYFACQPREGGSGGSS